MEIIKEGSTMEQRRLWIERCKTVDIELTNRMGNCTSCKVTSPVLLQVKGGLAYNFWGFKFA